MHAWFMNFTHKASNQSNFDMATIIEYPVDEHAQIHSGDPMTTSWSILSSVFVDYNGNNATLFWKFLSYISNHAHIIILTFEKIVSTSDQNSWKSRKGGECGIWTLILDR